VHPRAARGIVRPVRCLCRHCAAPFCVAALLIPSEAMSTPNLLRLLFLAALWGASFLFMRVASPVLGAVPSAFWRVVLGALGLLALLLVMRVPPAFRGRLPALLALGAINSGIPFLMYSLAAQVLPAGYSAILNALTPLMGVVIGAAFFGEGVSRAKMGGVILGLGGVAVLTQAGPVALNVAVLGGVLACLVATACYGLAGFLVRRWIAGWWLSAASWVPCCVWRRYWPGICSPPRPPPAIKPWALSAGAHCWRWGCCARPLPMCCCLT
jgi:drug/metabolite transporter (DMT)-like permease